MLAWLEVIITVLKRSLTICIIIIIIFYQYSFLECRSSACPKGAFAVHGSGIFSSLQKLYK